MRLVFSNLKDLDKFNWSLDNQLEQVGFDSLDTIDFIVQVEEKTNTSLLEEDQDKEFKTFRDIHDAIQRSLPQDLKNN
jgi:acyl carrier protein